MDKYQPHTYLLTLLAGDEFSAPGYSELERALFAAVDSGALSVADICIRDETAIGGFRSIRDSPGVCAQIRNGWISDGRGGKTYVMYLLEPAPFREWLKSTGRWPPPEGHALSEWLDVPDTEPCRHHFPSHGRETILMQEPKTKDEWFECIRDCVRQFESERRYTPTKAKLWIRLRTRPPEDYGITYDSRRKCLLMGDDDELNKEAFNKRYDRLYPPKSDK